MKTITAKEFYSGFDPANGQDFTLEEGESIEVSDEKIEQLERDGLIDRFDVGGKKTGKPAGDPLNELDRKGLNAKAEELGIPEPEKLKNIDAVKDAIREAIKLNEELNELDRDGLNAKALELGVTEPEGLDDDAVKDAIREALRA